MRRHSWLAGLYRQLTNPAFPARVRRTPGQAISAPAITESLERRQILSAGALALGSEVRVNSFTSGNQSQAVVAMDTAGNYTVAWSSGNQDGSGSGVFAQRFNSTGIARGDEFLVNTYTTNNQNGPSVAMDATGDSVIAWMSSGQDGSGYGVYAKRYNSAGVAQGIEFRVNNFTANDQMSPSATMDANGNFVITWQSAGQDGSDSGIYAQRYNAAGVAQGTEFKVNTFTNGAQDSAAAAMNAAGTLLVTWESSGQDGSGTGIYAQRYDPMGNAEGSEFQVNTFTSGDQRCPAVSIDTAGDFVVTWGNLSYQEPLWTIRARRYNAVGTAQGSDFQVDTLSTSFQRHPSVAMNATGDFVVTWNADNHVGAYYDIYAQQYNAVGAVEGSEFRVNSYTTGNQVFNIGRSHPLSSEAMDAAGEFVIVWRSDGQDGSGSGIYSQRFAMQFAPVLSQIESTPLNVIGTQPVSVTSSLQASDPDSQNLTGATVKITGNYHNGEDVLGFANTAKITGAWDAGNGTLTLTGTDTVANYTAALRSVKYLDTMSVPNTAATRTIHFTVTDGFFTSNIASREVTVRATSTSPVLSGLNGTANYVEGAAHLAIAPNLTVNGLTIATASVSFTNWQAEDRVDFTNTLSLRQSFTQDLTAHTAVLTMTGNATAAQYQTILRSVVYWDVSDNPDPSITRTARFTVNDINGAGGSGTQNIKVTPVNDPPVVSVNDTTPVAYKVGGPAAVIMGNAAITDADSTDLNVVTIKITSGYQNNAAGHDRLSFIDQLGIKGEWDDVSGTLFLVGPSSVTNFINALRTVTFSASGSVVSTATRTITVTATDNSAGTGATSQPVTRNVTVKLDVAPVLSQIESSPLHVIGTQPVHLTASLVASDQDDSNLAGATVKITGNYQNGEDVLSFVNTANITASWDAATGTLMLTGSDTVANYTAALRNVTYHDTMSIPNTAATRTIRFQVTDGILPSNAMSRDLTDRATSTSPVLSGLNGTTNFVENSAAVTIAPNLVVDSLTVTSASVSFTNWQAEDRVQFHNIYALQHTFTQDLTAHTGVLTITGNATAAQYQTLLRSVIYWDVADNPQTSIIRTAKFTVIDLNSDGGAGTQNVTVTAVVDPPVVSVNGPGTLAYQIGGPALAIMSNALVSDPDSTNLTKLTVQITSGYQNDANGHDLLSFTTLPGITGAFDPAKGLLTLSGTSYVGNYREALRLVTFSTSGSAVSTATRTFTVIATDDTTPTPASSVPVTRDVTVAFDVAPVLSQIETTPLNVIGMSPVPLTTSLTVADQDNANLQGATVRIATNYQSGEDILSFTNTAKITGAWDASTGTLKLTGSDTVANYNAALLSVTYHDTMAAPNTAATRTIDFQVTDGILPSDVESRDLTDRASSTSPILSGVTQTVSYPENAAALTLAPDLVVDSLNVTSATVSFINWQGGDRIQFHNIYALQHTFTEDLSAHTAVLTITGNATAAQYQTLLRSVIFWNVSENPNTSATRIARLTVIDVNSDGGAGTQNLTVTSLNDPPVVLVNDPNPLTYPVNGPAVAIMSNALVSDPDSTDLTKLTIQITSGYQNDAGGHDILSFTSKFGITGVFESATGTLTLSGTSYVGNYREVLRTVTFNTSGSNVSTATRTLTLIATDDAMPTHASSLPVTRDILMTT